ncbi:unnamed protein product [Linum tenue]|nr:unnamed protein product [Linum tenue]
MRWYKGFNPWKSQVSSTLVWVQLPDLPIEFINKEAAMKIGSLIGKAIRVDRATELGARGKFARVCVEVDLTRPLLGRYKVEGIEYLIQYEGLENICTDYGQYGKSTLKCSCKDPVVVVETVEEVPETQEEESSRGPNYGDWMMVKKKGRYQSKQPLYKEGRGDKAQFVPKQGSESNRFAVFKEDTTNETQHEDSETDMRKGGTKGTEKDGKKWTCPRDRENDEGCL